MIRLCYRCGVVIGEKEPIEDISVTSGLCDSCFDIEKREIEELLGRMEVESFPCPQ